MTAIDVFNGDADGICALLQLRQDQPGQNNQLITGIKRDIQLLKQVSVQDGDRVTVLDISLDKNRNDLQRLLDNGAQVFYSDHHFYGDLPEHPNLTTRINTDADICTSLLINQYLDNRHYLWAVTGAFGDNLNHSALTLATQHRLNSSQTEQLKQLGILINYNGYGADINDLHFHPADLFKQILPHNNPFDFINDSQSVFQQLKDGYDEDNKHVNDLSCEYQSDKVAVFILPDAPWARRMSGIFSNELVNRYPDRAHAVVTHNKQGGYLISVRAPLNNKTGADDLCRQFETGGGRKAAAGINHLPVEQLDNFIKQFSRQFTNN